MSTAVGAGIVDRFELVELAGKGGMGEVYLALDLAAGSRVALKLLSPASAADRRLRGRFEAEAQALRVLRVPGIPRFVAAGLTEDATPFIAMEWMSGSSLGARTRQPGGQTFAHIIRMLDGLLEIVAGLHEQGWAHGDIKSGNVLVVPDHDGAVEVALVDLGLARRLRGDDAATVVQEVCGTPEYMAPEMANGAPATVATDLYAIGALLYELLTGAPPFEGSTATSVLFKQVEDVVVPPSMRCGSCPYTPAIDELIRRALDKDPRQRFTSARGMHAALDGAMSGLGDEGVVPTGVASARHAECVTRPMADEGSPVTEEERSSPLPSPMDNARARIGDALATGQAIAALEGYLRLAHVLEARRDDVAALRVLREAAEVLTRGRGARSEDAPVDLWRLLIELAALEDLVDGRPRAVATAGAALRHAQQACSAEGTRHAMDLCRRLGMEHRDSRGR